MLQHCILWKNRFGYYKKRSKKKAKVYSFLEVKTLELKRKKRLKKVLNQLLKFRKKNKKTKRRKKKVFKTGVSTPLLKKKLVRSVKKFKTGIVRVNTSRRNIFATLSSVTGRLLLTVTTGILGVKGKERQATHVVRATANLLVKKLKKEQFRYITYILTGYFTRKKKRLFYDTLRKIKNLKIKKIIVVAPRAHNGCRPSKKRRL